MNVFNLYLPSSCLGIPFSQLWAEAGLYHEAPCRNDSFGVATCCAPADWLKKCNIAELNG